MENKVMHELDKRRIEKIDRLRERLLVIMDRYCLRASSLEKMTGLSWRTIDHFVRSITKPLFIHPRVQRKFEHLVDIIEKTGKLPTKEDLCV